MTILSRWKTSDVVVLLTITSVRKNITGSLFTASFMQAVSIIITAEITMNIRWRNGLGACATQYSSEFMDVEVFRDGYKYDLHFEKGRNVGGLKRKKQSRKRQVQRHIGDLTLKFSLI